MVLEDEFCCSDVVMCLSVLCCSSRMTAQNCIDRRLMHNCSIPERLRGTPAFTSIMKARMKRGECVQPAAGAIFIKYNNRFRGHFHLTSNQFHSLIQRLWCEEPFRLHHRIIFPLQNKLAVCRQETSRKMCDNTEYEYLMFHQLNINIIYSLHALCMCEYLSMRRCRRVYTFKVHWSRIYRANFWCGRKIFLKHWQLWVPYKSWWHAIEGMNSTAHYKSDGACWITVKFTVIWIWKLLVVKSFRNLSLKICSKQWLKSTTTNSIYYTTVVSYTSNTRPISVTHTHHKGKHYDNDAFEHIVYVELESW